MHYTTNNSWIAAKSNHVKHVHLQQQDKTKFHGFHLELMLGDTIVVINLPLRQRWGLDKERVSERKQRRAPSAMRRDSISAHSCALPFSSATGEGEE